MKQDSIGQISTGNAFPEMPDSRKSLRVIDYVHPPESSLIYFWDGSKWAALKILDYFLQL